MKLSAVLLARFYASIETADLNPRGRAYFPEITAALVEKFGFAKYPEKLEDYDEKKGVRFQGGRSGEITILEMTVFDAAIYVDTNSSTVDSEGLFNEVVAWLSRDHALTYTPEMVQRKTYVSQVSFYSEAIFPNLNPALIKIAKRLSARVPEYFGQPLEYRPSAFTVGYDPMTVKSGPAPFTIEPRSQSLFTENKYFSTAPLPTEEHIQALEEFEADLLAQA